MTVEVWQSPRSILSLDLRKRSSLPPILPSHLQPEERSTFPTVIDRRYSTQLPAERRNMLSLCVLANPAHAANDQPGEFSSSARNALNLLFAAPSLTGARRICVAL